MNNTMDLVKQYKESTDQGEREGILDALSSDLGYIEVLVKRIIDLERLIKEH